jgi:DNA-binding transcriptional ArsR family regulator
MVPLFTGSSKNRPSFNTASIEIEKYMKQPNIVTYAHALCSDTRVHILHLVGTTGMSTTDIASSTGLATSTVSFHLGELARVGLVTKRRKGRNVLYRWSDTRLSLQIEQVQPAPQPSTVTP